MSSNAVPESVAGELYVTEADNFCLQKRGVDGKWSLLGYETAHEGV